MKHNFYEPLKQAKWQLWYQDHFDLECPRQLVLEGRDLVEGLQYLWAYHLQETVQNDGSLGFSHFNLWWCQEQRSIKVGEGKIGLINIKHWLSSSTSDQPVPDLKVGNSFLLEKLAAAHLHLITKDQTHEVIIEAAEHSKSREEFELRLARMTQENL